MSLAEACAWSVLRSLLITCAALLLGRLLCRLLASARRETRGTLWFLLIAPYFAPELLVGYAYSQYWLSLVHHPVWNGVFYAVLLGMKLIPLGAVVLWFSPPPSLTAVAVHCRRLAFRPDESPAARTITTLGYLIRGPARSLLPAFAVIFLLSFQEFEMASLMGVTAGTVRSPASWTVWLFDAQVGGGLAISESLKRAVWPFLVEAILLLTVYSLVIRGDGAADERATAPTPAARVLSRRGVAGGLCYLAAAFLLLWIVPSFVVVSSIKGGPRSLLLGLQLKEEILTSLSVALGCGLLAYAVAAWVTTLARQARSTGGTGTASGTRAGGTRIASGTRAGGTRTASGTPARSAGVPTLCGVALSTPGLFGSLMLGLVLLSLFQQPWLSWLNVASLPLMLGLTLYLLPRAFLLQLLLRALQPDESLYSAQLLRSSPSPVQSQAGRELIWQLRLRGHFWSVVLLCYWGYWELTLPSLLAPPGMDSAPMLLYNFMHYGRIATLTSMLFATIAVPAVLLLLVALARRRLLHWLV